MQNFKQIATAYEDKTTVTVNLRVLPVVRYAHRLQQRFSWPFKHYHIMTAITGRVTLTPPSDKSIMKKEE